MRMRHLRNQLQHSNHLNLYQLWQVSALNIYLWQPHQQLCGRHLCQLGDPMVLLNGLQFAPQQNQLIYRRREQRI